MLRQLARLTRVVPAAGERALAIAVYADANDVPRPASDLGYEGVACVDDAARGVVLLADLHERTGIPFLREWARGLLTFVLAMQADDGTFVNFVQDWSGAPNRQGVTSRAGGLFWHARAMRATACGKALGEAHAAKAHALARAAIPETGVPSDVRVLHLLDAVDAFERGDVARRPEVERWSDEVAACRAGDVLLDQLGQRSPHLWAHLQEAVLARCGRALGRDGLIELAARSAEVVFVPLIESGFDVPMTQPYEVACAIAAMDELAIATSDPRYPALARRARGWFETLDRSGHPVYDRVRGRVGDGVDNGLVNRDSGAESNIVAAQSLIEDLAARLRGESGLRDQVAAILAERTGRVLR